MRVFRNPSDEQIVEFLKLRGFSLSQLEREVAEIVQRVKEEGDRALGEFLRKFEKCPISVEQLRVSREEIEKAIVPEDFVETVKHVVEDVRRYHLLQKEESRFFTTERGSILGEMVVPLESVGIYVPGGKVPYFSTLLMCAVPAQVAGVERIVVATPPDETGKVSPLILKCCEMLGIEEVYKMGGAHAIAALAYGTESVKPVEKIVGPGGRFVTLAKKIVFGDVGIDSVAGPSEIAIIADDSAPKDYVAADFLSQAEHDEMAMSVLITTSEELFEGFPSLLLSQLNALPTERKATAEKAIENFGLLVFVDRLERAFEISNLIAPEHLEVMVKDPFRYLGMVRNAGSVFLGVYSCEPVGDYGAGPNHVLPTFGTARFSSGLRVSDFTKKVFFTYFSEKEFVEKFERYLKMARWESLEAHAKAIEVRRRKP